MIGIRAWPAMTLAIASSLASSSGLAADSAAGLRPVCQAESGPRRLPLVALYTSEGCSSCPPADRRLQAMAREADPPLVPVAWHVAYWDHLGWRDPYASPAHAQQQRREVAMNGGRTLYTPQFFVSGREVRDPGLVPTEAQRVARSPAEASLRATAIAAQGGGWQLAVSARGPAQRPLELVVALTENDLVSSVKAGENAGERLRHGHVVRQSWRVPVDGAGGIDWRQPVQVTPEQAGKGLALVAFVQDTRNGEVLQALQLPRCIGTADR